MERSIGCKMAELEPIKSYNCTKTAIWTHSLEHEVKRPLYFTNITGHIEPILEQNEYCEDNVLNLKRHSWTMLFVRCLDLLRFSCNQ